MEKAESVSMDEREAVENVGQILNGCLKAPDLSRPEEVEDRILSIVKATVVTPAWSTREYEKRCNDFLERVIGANGLPVRSVLADGMPRATGIDLPKNADLPLEALRAKQRHCVETYDRQAQLYLRGEMDQFRALLSQFLDEAFNARPVPKELKHKVTAIKRAFRDLTKWDRLFSTIKNNSFPASVNRTFSFENNPLAVMWSYSPLDEAGEFRNAYSHKELAGRVYAVRGNWALDKGFMETGPHGYVEDAPIPREEFDCTCNYRFIYHLRDLPEAMLTPKGLSELARAKTEVARLLGKSS